MIINWGLNYKSTFDGSNVMFGRVAGFGSLPTSITLQDLFSGKFPVDNQKFTVGGVQLAWKDNALFEVLTGDRRYNLLDNVLSLIS